MQALAVTRLAQAMFETLRLSLEKEDGEAFLNTLTAVYAWRFVTVDAGLAQAARRSSLTSRASAIADFASAAGVTLIHQGAPRGDAADAGDRLRFVCNCQHLAPGETGAEGLCCTFTHGLVGHAAARVFGHVGLRAARPAATSGCELTIYFGQAAGRRGQRRFRYWPANDVLADTRPNAGGRGT